ncbi:MAG: SGNH/GDSL hydrolase family protein [Micromonosporaceae bacterium]|nr:SGNH/GDSL hydrolase family protein [Micromonosporaceae bacterium]
MRWRSFVAIGDSFTEGLNDILPDGRLRGWADLVAARLAAERAARSTSAEPRSGEGRAANSGAANGSTAGQPLGGEGRAASSGAAISTDDGGFRYANLAVRGRLFHRIVDEQVPVALEMAPDLVSFAGGGNDALRPSFDPAPLLARFDELVRTFRATGADVILFRWVDVSNRLPGRRLILPRTRILNDAVAEMGDRHGAVVVDLWEDDEFQNPLLWSDDRLHLSTAGHQRVAAHVLTRLGVDPDPQWWASPGQPPRLSWPLARVQDLRWAREHLAPWIKRRLTGRSSGDLLGAKRPTLAPFPD